MRDPNNVGADMLSDNLKRNAQRTDTFGDVTKTDYDRSGNAIYHATGALNQLKLDGTTVSTRSYDVGRRQTTELLGNSITETRTYRNDNLLSTIAYSNTNIGNLGYSWDANKNKIAETISGVMSGYGFNSAGTSYDFEDRLTGYARTNGTMTQSWNLTSVGDWTSVTTNGTAQSRTHGPTHELLTAGGSNVTTDVKGNMTAIPASLREAGATTAMNLGYDFDNRMRSTDIDANSSVDVNTQYDALGRRVARTGTSSSLIYVQADQQTIADYVVGQPASNPLYRYVFASYIDEPVVRKTVGTGGTVLYMHRNQQYSIYALTDSTGAVTERYAYTAYGQPTFLNASAAVQTSSAANNRYTYTAREWDGTIGLHHFRARWMSGLSGRFLSRDPIGYEGSQWNLYEYCRTNPFKYNDPHGDVPILIPVAGAVIIITEAEAVAAAFGLSVFACLQNQQCRAAMDQAVRNAVNRLDRAAQRALKLACSSAHRAYKAVENSCGRCDKRKAPTCFEQTARCISASLSFGCFQTAAGLRAAYVASGCDVVSPTLVNHPGAANQALMASENCAKAMENNCFQPIF